MKVALLLLVLCGVASADVSPVLPGQAIKDVTGCWRGHDETWTFRRDGAQGVRVIRNLRADRPEVQRARLPRTVSFDASSQTFGFGAAGRIHALMMLFTIKSNALEVTVFASHQRGQWFATGSVMTMRPC